MSPRAAWRLETLGFEQVFDYVGGKADWLAHGLPREGETAAVPYAGELVDSDPPTCALSADVATVRAALENAKYGFCLVVNDERVVLGRVRRSALEGVKDAVAAESVMEPGPSTVRPNQSARELAGRLASDGLRTAIVATPDGRLLGVFDRNAAEQRLNAANPA
jgi:CBS domain-containing protein